MLFMRVYNSPPQKQATRCAGATIPARVQQFLFFWLYGVMGYVQSCREQLFNA